MDEHVTDSYVNQWGSNEGTNNAASPTVVEAIDNYYNMQAQWFENFRGLINTAENETKESKFSYIFRRLREGDMIPPGPFQDWLHADFKNNHCQDIGHGSIRFVLCNDSINTLTVPEIRDVFLNRFNQWRQHEVAKLIMSAQGASEEDWSSGLTRSY